jgi:hypothetical protein
MVVRPWWLRVQNASSVLLSPLTGADGSKEFDKNDNSAVARVNMSNT